MARGKLNQSVKWAQAKANARAILENLGIESSRLKKLDIESWTPEPVVKLPVGMKRFRRTKEELKQLKEFTQWQLQQRIEKNSK